MKCWLKYNGVINERQLLDLAQAESLIAQSAHPERLEIVRPDPYTAAGWLFGPTFSEAQDIRAATIGAFTPVLSPYAWPTKEHREPLS